MKFDFIIGNPPYQEEVENNGRKNPLYNSFMENTYKLADTVELITPARFLFNAGQTPKAWNKKMLNDEHLKVLYYEQDSSKVFPNTDIKGGVAITLHDEHQNFEKINVFTAYPELNDILANVFRVNTDKKFLSSIVSARGQYRFSDALYEDYPEVTDIITGGTGNMIVSNIFERLDNIFLEDVSDTKDYYKILGRIDNVRVYRYIKKPYVISNKFLSSYNVVFPKSSGSGIFGETLSETVILSPDTGATDTFISIGCFDSAEEASSLSKYIKTKFARCLLFVKKVTQDNSRAVWEFIPIQDFTPNSDIDWTKSISEIDRQLYTKYGLNDDEIAFIESHVKEMN